MGARSSLWTPVCDLLGIDVPIVQAPIGRISGPALAAAVTEAGGLGMLGLSFADDGDLRSAIRATRELTDRPFGVNLILKWDQRDRLSSCLDEGARIVSYFWADLERGSPYIEEAHAVGAVVMLTVGTAAEARRAVDAGVDVIVAQGVDAGGHVWGSVGTLALVPVVADAVAPTPVMAAGGVSDGRGLAAVLALGAQAAWLGTRFVVADESRADASYKERLLRASETDAVWSTGVFDTGFEDAPVRTLNNSTLRSLQAVGSPSPVERPREGEIIAHRSDGSPVHRYDFAPPVDGMTGELEAMANYAGQGVGLVTRIQPAGEIVRDIAAEAARVLISLGSSAK